MTNPIPLRIRATMLSQLPNRDSSNSEGECLLGLAIQSYMDSSRHELLYVALLNDGHEVHVPCDDVHSILLTTVTGKETLSQQTSFSNCRDLPGHPSSVDFGEDT